MFQTFRPEEIAGIQIATSPFLVSAGEIPEALRQSVREHGVLSPVLLARVPLGNISLVTGRKRLELAREFSLPLPANILEEFDPRRIFLSGLEENFSARGLNALEKSLALQKFSKLSSPALEPTQLAKELASLLNVPQRSEIISAYMAFTTLPPAAQKALMAGELTEQQGILLARVPSDARELFCDLVCGRAVLNGSETRDVFSIVEQLATVSSWKELLSDSAVQACLSEEQLPPKKRGEKARAALKAKQLPRITETLERLRRLTDSVAGNTSLKFSFPPFLEGEALDISCRIKTVDDLGKIMERLEQALSSGDFQKIIDVLRRGSFKE